MHTLSVSALNEQIKTLLETSFSHVYVEGEISRITFHNSGHIYFTLKDSESALSAVMFRGNASKLKFRLEEGMKVIVDGAITLYKPRGSYQINCFSIQPSGQGALALAYEQLKEKLAAKGYFAEERKKAFPKFVKKIALITSATGAALQDMLRVANHRYRLLDVDIYDVLVQGESAATQIARAIKLADTKGYDALVIGRGGGSIEDLWAFNEEIVADAVFDAQTPIVSAVGHEIDWVISDFVADMRAPTPSAAMQMLLPDTNELYLSLDALWAQMSQLLSQKIQTKLQALNHLKNSYQQHSIEKKITQKKEEIAHFQERFTQHIAYKIQGSSRDIEYIKVRYPSAIDNTLNINRNQVLHLMKMLESNNPKNKTKKGFAQISKDSKVVELESLELEDIFEVMSDSLKISAKVLEKKSF
jgi:exodeoxyribonuclease VII large subunit